MKKLSLIFGLALGMLTVGCSEATIFEQDGPAAGNTITLGVNLDEQARTSLGELVGDKYSVLWSAGDKIAVNGVASEAVAEQYVGKSSAVFTIADVTAPYNVIYPANALNENGQLALSNVQEYAAGSFAEGVAVMAGYTASADMVTLNHMLSFIKLTIAQGSEATAAFNSISLTSLSGRAVSGLFDVDYQGAEITPVAGAGKDVVTVTNVPIVDGKAVVYLAVPSGEYVNGFEVKVVGSDNTVMSRTAYTANGINLGDGYLVTMPELTFAGKQTDEIVITSAEQLQILRETTLASENTFRGTIKLGCDIDMTGVNLDGVQAYLYDGATFDGQGYAIKNWTACEGLIYENYGTVKNIVLDKSCQLSYELSSVHKICGFVVMCNVSGTVSGCVNNANITGGDSSVDFTGNRFLGSIVGCTSAGVNPGNADPNDPDKFDYNGAAAAGILFENARVENCINNGNITVTANSYNSGWLYVGGVVGISWQHVKEGNGGLFNCANTGDVAVNIGTNGKVTAVGGVIAAAGKIYPNPDSNKLRYLTLENCVNSGAVSYNCDTMNNPLYMGGIVGYNSGKSISLVNNGAVTFNANSASKGNKFIGGVAGLFTCDADDCHNTGAVTVENYEFTDNLLYVGGVFGVWSGGNVTDKLYTVSNTTNSGAVTVMYNTEKSTILAFGGILSYAANKSTINSSQYLGKIQFVDCKNSGDIYVDRQGVAQSRPMVGGMLGYYDLTYTFVRCVNEGDITVNMTGAAKDAAVGGIAGTLYAGMEDCKQLGNLTLNCTDSTNGAIIGGFGGRQGNNLVTWNGCVLKSEINHTADKGIICGLLQGDYWGSSNALTVGAITPCVVKSTSKVNGEAVTAEQLKEVSFLVGRDQKLADGTVEVSSFVIAEGGLILE